ncbi:hypothetical protein V9J99_003450 [Vibrio cholerae]
MNRECRQTIQKYKQQRYQAENIRNIPWEFTYTTWCDFWEASGKWEERGRELGQYVMGRRGDQGAYSPENCYIITNTENTLERLETRGKPNSNQSEDRDTKAYYIYNGERFEKQQDIVDITGYSLRWIQKLVTQGVIGKYKDETYRLYVTPMGKYKKFKDALDSCGDSVRSGKITRQTLWHRFNNENMPEYYTYWHTETHRLNKESEDNINVLH